MCTSYDAAYQLIKSRTFLSKPRLSMPYCSAASVFSGSSKSQRSVKRELRPQTTSFRVLVGSQPVPSRECSLSILRHILPSSVMLGCQIRVLHLAIGGLMLYSGGMLISNTKRPFFQKPSSGLTISVKALKSSTSLNSILHVFGKQTWISDTSCVRKRLRTLICLLRGGASSFLDASSLRFCCSLNMMQH